MSPAPSHKKIYRSAAVVTALVLAAAGAVASPSVAGATTVLFGHVAGENLPQCDDNLLPPTDDDQSTPIPLGSQLNLRGTTFSDLIVDNNGQLIPGTDGTNEEIYPDLSIHSASPTLAGFGSDVRTDQTGGGAVTYGLGTDGVFCAVWNNVGYYNSGNPGADKLNTFQILVTPKGGTPGRVAGDFDITYNYDAVQWDRNGKVAIGYSAGPAAPETFYRLDGSYDNDTSTAQPGVFVDGGSNPLISHSLNSSQPGRYIFPITNTADATHVAPS